METTNDDCLKTIQATSAILEKLGNKLGIFIQELVYPSLCGLFYQYGFNISQTVQSVSIYDNKCKFITEIGLLAFSENKLIIVDCKSQPSIDDVNEHLERLDLFKTNFPQYTNFCIFGAIAAMVLPQQVNEYAIRKGLYSLAQSGDAMTIHNEAVFVPKQW